MGELFLTTSINLINLQIFYKMLLSCEDRSLETKLIFRPLPPIHSLELLEVFLKITVACKINQSAIVLSLPEFKDIHANLFKLMRQQILEFLKFLQDESMFWNVPNQEKIVQCISKYVLSNVIFNHSTDGVLHFSVASQWSMAKLSTLYAKGAVDSITKIKTFWKTNNQNNFSYHSSAVYLQT